MTSSGSTLGLHPVVMWSCNRTAVKQLLYPVSSRSSSRSSSSSGSDYKQLTGNVAFHFFTAATRKHPLSNLFWFSCRFTSSTQQAPQPHIRSALFDQLNAEQMAAVQTEEDCVRVVAGPGSGKTLVLTHRIAHLIENRGVDPSKILCLTFTNKAKNELLQRLHNLLGDRSSKLTIGTFHSVCVRMLRESNSKDDVGFDKDFVIYDTHDSVKVIKKALETTLGMDSKEGDKVLTNKKQNSDSRAIQDASKSITQIKEYELKKFLAKQNQSHNLPTMPPHLKSAMSVFKGYQSILRSYNAVDFDDLIYLTVRMLYQQKDLCQKYQNHWKYVLADEFQDTDWAQYVLVRLLCATNQKLFVVGDVDQAIYGWRGADYKNMDDLELHFQSLSTFELRKNYRSSQNILKLASEVINRSSHSARDLRPLTLQPMKSVPANDEVLARTLLRFLQDGLMKPVMEPLKSRGPPVTVVSCLDSDQEAIYVLKKISTLVARKEAAYRSFGVLYRTRAQGEALEKWCLSKQIPYTRSGSVALLSYKEVKDLCAYLQLIWNPEDRVALDRIINMPPRGLGAKTLKNVEQWASDLNISFYQALQKVSREEINHKTLGITKRSRNSILEFCKLQDDLLRLSENDFVSTLIQEVIDRTELLEYYKPLDGNEGRCASHLQLFQESSISMDNDHGRGRSALCSFLEAITLSASLDQEDEKVDVVKLSTLHAAKGLEFDYVFITGAEDGTLPLDNSDVDEERRLFYVGVTRARKELVITTRMQRIVPGIGFREGEPSRFLDLPSNLYKKKTIVGSILGARAQKKQL